MRRNPNGFGCVVKLGGNRRRPYGARVTKYDANGLPRQVYVGYSDTRAGALQILADYNRNPWSEDRDKLTVADIYQQWRNVKAPQVGTATVQALAAAYKYISKYYKMPYRQIRSYHMQQAIDDCQLSHSVKGSIKNLWHHLDKFAFECDVIEKMYSDIITAGSAPETNRKPFTQAEIDLLWAASETDDTAKIALMYIYTGFRLTELLRMERANVDLDAWTLTGGVKTKAGKNRIVPIHPRIQQFVEYFYARGGDYLIATKDGGTVYKQNFYKAWKPLMERLRMYHTVHETRHTFETMLDNAGANRRCIDLLMGHASRDIGNRVYNHKTLEQLRQTVMLLQ